MLGGLQLVIHKIRSVENASASIDECLEIDRTKPQPLHAVSLLAHESRCKPVEIAMLSIIDFPLRTFQHWSKLAGQLL